MTEELHPAQNRGLRELYATARQMLNHWSKLSGRVTSEEAASVLERGAAEARRLLDELADLTAEFDLYGGTAAHGVGRNIAGARNGVGDAFLEQNQAIRLAVLDIQHVVTLLGYQTRVAKERGQHRLTGALSRWQRDLRALEDEAREAAIACGDDPDAAVEPLSRGPAGRVAHGANYWVGTFGEWFDRRTSKR